LLFNKKKKTKPHNLCKRIYSNKSIKDIYDTRIDIQSKEFIEDFYKK